MDTVKNNGWLRFARKHNRTAGKFRFTGRRVGRAPIIPVFGSPVQSRIAICVQPSSP
jgi:hypothetical protein